MKVYFLVLSLVTTICNGRTRDMTVYLCPPPGEPGSVTYPHPSDCTLYYRCNNGVAQLEQCPNGLYWNPNMKKCVPPEESDCVPFGFSTTTAVDSTTWKIDRTPKPDVTTPEDLTTSKIDTTPKPDVTTPEDLTTSKIDTTPKPDVTTTEDPMTTQTYTATELPPENPCVNITIPSYCEWYANSCTDYPIRCPDNLNFNPETLMCEDPCKVDIQGCKCPFQTCENFTIPFNCEWYANNCTDYPIQCPDNLNFNPETRKCEDPCKVDIQGCKCPFQTCENFTIPFNCEWYSNNCTDGPLHCPDKLNFNPETRKCEDPCKVDIKDCPCLCNPNKCCLFTRDETDCQLYYNDCSQMWSRCPGNLHFNEVTQSCDHPCRAGCKDPNDITECCTTEGEVFEDTCSCNTYYVCRNGIKELDKCEDGQQYNSSSHLCENSCSCDCAKLFSGKPECCASTGGKPEPQCPVTTYPIFFPHPKNGQFFYTCLNGVRSCSRCPLQHRWNIDTDTCDGTSCTSSRSFLFH